MRRTTPAAEILQEAPVEHVLEPLCVVDEWSETQKAHRRDPVRVTDQRLRLNDGSTYDARIYEPRQQKFEVPVAFTTAWCTDLEGFNDMNGKKLAEHGMPVIAISPERYSLRNLRKGLQRLSLEHDAHAQHAVLDHGNGHPAMPSGTEKVLTTGYSRGAMVGLGVIAISHMYGRNVLYSNFVDPTLEHEVSTKDVDWSHLPSYLGREVLELGGCLRHYGARELGQVRKTVRLSPIFWIQQAATMRPLFSGQTGHFVETLPPSTTADVTLYDSSIFNHADAWRQKLAPFPNIRVHDQSGYHMSGADPAVAASTITRMRQAQLDLQECRDLDSARHDTA